MQQYLLIACVQTTYNNLKIYFAFETTTSFTFVNFISNIKKYLMLKEDSIDWYIPSKLNMSEIVRQMRQKFCIVWGQRKKTNYRCASRVCLFFNLFITLELRNVYFVHEHWWIRAYVTIIFTYNNYGSNLIDLTYRI